MRGICRILPVLLVAVVATGCITSGRCRVGVANVSDNMICSVVVADTNGNTYAFANLAPHSEPPGYKPINGKLEKGIVLRITGEDGTNVSRTVDLARPVAPDARGSLLFQIENNAQVRTFFQPEDEAARRDIGWSQAPSWQGTIMVPGVPGQQY